MSKLCYFDVSGWQEDGSPLPAENKQEVIDILEELIADDFKQDLSEDSTQFMRFSTEYEFAPEEVQEACSKYAKAHPRIVLELEYSDHDEEVFQQIRFKGKLCEHHDAAYHFMPFKCITIPKEQSSLPVIEFTYGSVETEDALSLMVLLDRTLSLKELDSLEDSISSYAEENTDYCFEELIRDVLEAAGVEYWIISPMASYCSR
ncbi:MAG: hypothetical protein IJ089_00850 [Clostridia bacterium]|nr:hypothetical protein [Clostridia bacterium]